MSKKERSFYLIGVDENDYSAMNVNNNIGYRYFYNVK